MGFHPSAALGLAAGVVATAEQDDVNAEITAAASALIKVAAVAVADADDEAVTRAGAGPTRLWQVTGKDPGTEEFGAPLVLEQPRECLQQIECLEKCPRCLRFDSLGFAEETSPASVW